ncbi:MAG: GntR family transcriptional regulator [Actinomycetota bacterium]|nr:GntR family transcriptional regulator [Actinomycetota bacterium]
MLIRIDPRAVSPLFEQIAAAVRGEIAAAAVRPGEQLPPARQLAGSLGVNMHTVLRAYQLLREEGLVEMRRGRGVVVTSSRPHESARLSELVSELTAQARRLGLEPDQAAELIRKAMSC